jgi:hypothetical protein
VTGHSFVRQGRFLLTALPIETKALITACWAIVASGWGWLLSRDLSSRTHPVSVVLDMVLLGVGGAAMLAFGVLEAFRFAAWLEGTTLVARHALWTVRCDLARSAVSLGTSRGLPLLRARDEVTGRRVRLVLAHTRGRTLYAPPKLFALADAIVAGRHQDPRACQVAAAVRALGSPGRDGIGAF